MTRESCDQSRKASSCSPCSAHNDASSNHRSNTSGSRGSAPVPIATRRRSPVPAISRRRGLRANLERETDGLLTAGPAMLQCLEQELVVVIGGLFEPSPKLAVDAAREAGRDRAKHDLTNEVVRQRESHCRPGHERVTVGGSHGPLGPVCTPLLDGRDVLGCEWVAGQGQDADQGQRVLARGVQPVDDELAHLGIESVASGKKLNPERRAAGAFPDERRLVPVMSRSELECKRGSRLTAQRPELESDAAIGAHDLFERGA